MNWKKKWNLKDKKRLQKHGIGGVLDDLSKISLISWGLRTHFCEMFLYESCYISIILDFPYDQKWRKSFFDAFGKKHTESKTRLQNKCIFGERTNEIVSWKNLIIFGYYLKSKRVSKVDAFLVNEQMTWFG